jgi:hypothetical protein
LRTSPTTSFNVDKTKNWNKKGTETLASFHSALPSSSTIFRTRESVLFTASSFPSRYFHDGGTSHDRPVSRRFQDGGTIPENSGALVGIGKIGGYLASASVTAR